MARKRTNNGGKRRKRRAAGPEARPDERAGNGAEAAPMKMPKIDPDVIRTGSNCPDFEVGLKAVIKSVIAAFDLRHGPAMEKARLLVETLEAQSAHLMAALEDLRKKKSKTPETTPTPHTKDQRNESKFREVRFHKWQRRHQLEGVLSFGALITVLVASLFGAHGTLVASGLPIFVEQPALPYLISAIAPCTGVALKFAGSSLHNEAARQRFRLLVHCASALSFAIWLALFTMKFQGLGGDLDIFAEANKFLDQGFTAFQILTEMLVGASLFLNLDKLMGRYAPDFETRTFAIENLERQEAELSAQIASVRQHLIPARGALKQLNANRDLHISAAELAYFDRRSRYEP